VRGSWRELIVTVPAEVPELIRPLRHLATANLLAWGAARPRVDEVVLCLSELVTNALRHTAGPARMRLGVRSGFVHLEVADLGGPDPTRPGDVPAGLGEHGRGLHIVRALGLSVEVRCVDRRSKSVIARFPLA
jgi:anti-sigma regulatory factor (Ser/Thr protein kinase)